MESVRTPVLAGCCCKTFQLGKCFDRNDTLIATCEDMFNATVASKCNSISNTTNNFNDPFEKQFDCSISGSCEPQDPPLPNIVEKPVAAIPTRLFIVGGIVVVTLLGLALLAGVMNLLCSPMFFSAKSGDRNDCFPYPLPLEEDRVLADDDEFFFRDLVDGMLESKPTPAEEEENTTIPTTSSAESGDRDDCSEGGKSEERKDVEKGNCVH